ncbi:hypothetical protein J5N97_007699 [Dioscorea zingiberensis]|uniref:DUF7890 domain-containing protein n=1 Tax=Dioscorea zingiberensis TaxID=325984 RepID=A0A9D5HUS0_9LILI|nr:hypothetical protein J5N97_007699 [Dioscorea zingiberensis]
MGNCLHCMANGAKRSKASTETKKQHGSKNLGNPFKMCMKPRDTRVLQVSSEKKTAAQNGEKGVMRVKIVLTKKEATQLLSQCDGDEEKMKNLLSELEKMKSNNNIGNITFTDRTNGDAWKPGLESIPEGCCVLVF